MLSLKVRSEDVTRLVQKTNKTCRQRGRRMRQKILLLLTVALTSGCLSVRVSLNQPPKTFSQEFENTKVVDEPKENLPSVLPSVFALTLSGITLSNIYALFLRDISGKEVSRLKASLVGAAVGATVGFGVGKSVQQAAREKRRLGRLLPKNYKRSKVIDSGNGVFLTIVPTLLLGSAGYLIGKQRVWNRDLGIVERESEMGAFIGGMVGGGIGFTLGRVMHHRMKKYKKAQRLRLKGQEKE